MNLLLISVATNSSAQATPVRQKLKSIAQASDEALPTRNQSASSHATASEGSHNTNTQQDQTAAEVAAAAGMVAAAAALQVIQSAGPEVEAQLQVCHAALLQPFHLLIHMVHSHATLELVLKLR